jgi:cell division septal protein FtsQ
VGVKIGVVVGLLALAIHHGARLADARGWLDPFRVREVRVEGITLANPNVLVAEAGLMGETVHWWTPLHDYVANVERDPLVQSASFHRRFPNGLTLEVVERRPVALLALDRLAPVDSTGRVLPVTAYREDFDAPVLTTPWPADRVARAGRVENPAVRAMLARLGEIAIHYPVLSREISAIRMESDGAIALTLVHAEGEVVMDHATPLAKLALVDDVVRDLRRKGVAYDRLDLRFEDQIVVSRNGEEAS